MSNHTSRGTKRVSCRTGGNHREQRKNSHFHAFNSRQPFAWTGNFSFILPNVLLLNISYFFTLTIEDRSAIIDKVLKV